MPEVPEAAQEAGDVVLVAEVQGVLVAFGAAGVDDGGDAGFDQEFGAVGEGEEGVAGGEGAVAFEWAAE